MSQHQHQFRQGQPVWHKGRPAKFLYYAHVIEATIRFVGRQSSTLVSVTALSAERDDKPRR